MHHRFRVGQVVAFEQQTEQVVGVDDGIFRDAAQAVGAEHPDVGVGPHQHGKVAVEVHHAADALRAVISEFIGCSLFLDNRNRQVGHKLFADADWAAAWAAAAMWR